MAIPRKIPSTNNSPAIISNETTTSSGIDNLEKPKTKSRIPRNSWLLNTSRNKVISPSKSNKASFNEISGINKQKLAYNVNGAIDENPKSPNHPDTSLHKARSFLKFLHPSKKENTLKSSQKENAKDNKQQNKSNEKIQQKSLASLSQSKITRKISTRKTSLVNKETEELNLKNKKLVEELDTKLLKIKELETKLLKNEKSLLLEQENTRKELEQKLQLEANLKQKQRVENELVLKIEDLNMKIEQNELISKDHKSVNDIQKTYEREIEKTREMKNMAILRTQVMEEELIEAHNEIKILKTKIKQIEQENSYTYGILEDRVNALQREKDQFKLKLNESFEVNRKLKMVVNQLSDIPSSMNVMDVQNQNELSSSSENPNNINNGSKSTHLRAESLKNTNYATINPLQSLDHSHISDKIITNRFSENYENRKNIKENSMFSPTSKNFSIDSETSFKKYNTTQDSNQKINKSISNTDSPFSYQSELGNKDEEMDCDSLLAKLMKKRQDVEKEYKKIPLNSKNGMIIERKERLEDSLYDLDNEISKIKSKIRNMQI